MIFVTGGTGLVGSHLLLALLRRGERVRALKREKSNTGQVLETFRWYAEDAENLFNRIEWVNGDILDFYSLLPHLAGIDTIYHCAAMISFDSQFHKTMLNSNIKGTANLVDAAIENGVKRICHVSSVSALGKTSNGETVSENTNWIPSRKNTGYSQSKFYSETEIWRGVEEGMDAIIVNPSIIIGPGNWSSGSPSFFRAIYKGMRFYTRGTTGYVDIRDVVDAMLLLMDNTNFEIGKNQRYLINAENLSYREFFTRVAKTLGRPAPSVYASPVLLEIAWRMSAIVSFIIRKPSLITRETASSGSSVTYFNGSKISEKFGFLYRSVDEAIEHTAKVFLRSGVKD
jgi:dihydroflavonol-4-reductase